MLNKTSFFVMLQWSKKHISQVQKILRDFNKPEAHTVNFSRVGLFPTVSNTTPDTNHHQLPPWVTCPCYRVQTWRQLFWRYPTFFSWRPWENHACEAFQFPHETNQPPFQNVSWWICTPHQPISECKSDRLRLDGAPTLGKDFWYTCVSTILQEKFGWYSSSFLCFFVLSFLIIWPTMNFKWPCLALFCFRCRDGMAS